jgi:hypothetical protein
MTFPLHPGGFGVRIASPWSIAVCLRVNELHQTMNVLSTSNDERLVKYFHPLEKAQQKTRTGRVSWEVYG